MHNMSNCKMKFNETNFEITPLEDGLFALRFSIETENGYGKPKSLDIVADTKNECVITGSMSNMLLYCLKGRRETQNG